jgi:hypothetical protein
MFSLFTDILTLLLIVVLALGFFWYVRARFRLDSVEQHTAFLELQDRVAANAQVLENRLMDLESRLPDLENRIVERVETSVKESAADSFKDLTNRLERQALSQVEYASIIEMRFVENGTRYLATQTRFNEAFEDLSRLLSEGVMSQLTVSHSIVDGIDKLGESLVGLEPQLVASYEKIAVLLVEDARRTENLRTRLAENNKIIEDQTALISQHSQDAGHQLGLAAERLERVHDLQIVVHDLQERLQTKTDALERSTEEVAAQVDVIHERAARVGQLETALNTTESKISALQDLETMSGQIKSELEEIRKQTDAVLKEGLDDASQRLTAITGWISSLSHDIGGSRRELARLTGDAMAEPSSSPRINFPKLVIVSGTMRSGTTLAGELLYSRFGRKPQHPQISFSNDLSNDVRDLSAVLRADANPPQACMDPEQEIPFDIDRIARFYDPASIDIENFSLEFIMRIRQGAPLGARPIYYGVKQTDLLQEPGLLARVFPTVKTIFMVRDPRAIYSSYKQRDINIYKEASIAKRQRSYSYFAVLISLGNLSRYLSGDDVSNNDDILILKYEDLIGETEASVERLLKFLNLDATLYDWSALRDGEMMSNSSYLGEASVTPVFNIGVSSDSLEAFRDRISPFETYVAERLGGEIMDRFGYQKTFRKRRRDFEKRLREKVIPALRRHAAERGYAAGFLDDFE